MAVRCPRMTDTDWSTFSWFLLLLQAVLLLKAWKLTSRAASLLSPADNGSSGASAAATAAGPGVGAAVATADASGAPALVADLVAQHAALLRELRKTDELRPLLVPTVHDDLFLLRYLLSAKGDLAKAVKNLSKAIKWRTEQASLLEGIDSLPEVQEVMAITPARMLPHRTAHGQPVQVVAPFAGDLHALTIKPERWHFVTGIANREASYGLCDQLTRSTGRLTKLVVIQDLSGLSMSALLEYSKGLQLQGNMSKLSEFLYPQMVATVVIVHAPWYVSRLHAMVKPLLSPKLLEKMKLVTSTAQLCEATGLKAEQLPTFLGGSFVWEGVEWRR